MLCSDILRFANLLFEKKVRLNEINLFKGKQSVRVSHGFELSEFKLRGVNYYKKHCQIQGNWI